MLFVFASPTLFSHLLVFVVGCSHKAGLSQQTVPTEVWVSILKERMKMFDCVKKGWILEGFPQTRQQALALQELGIYPKHCGQCLPRASSCCCPVLFIIIINNSDKALFVNQS